MKGSTLSSVERLQITLSVVYREGQHLHISRTRLASHDIDASWVERLEDAPLLAIEVEAFVSRFGRMQDTIGEKLLPRWLMAMAEKPGTLIEVLNRAERLGVIESTVDWIATRRLRNLLVHEYMESPALFAQALVDALEAVPILFGTYNRVREYSLKSLEMDTSAVPPPLPST